MILSFPIDGPVIFHGGSLPQFLYKADGAEKKKAP